MDLFIALVVSPIIAVALQLALNAVVDSAKKKRSEKPIIKNGKSVFAIPSSKFELIGSFYLSLFLCIVFVAATLIIDTYIPESVTIRLGGFRIAYFTGFIAGTCAFNFCVAFHQSLNHWVTKPGESESEPETH